MRRELGRTSVAKARYWAGPDTDGRKARVAKGIRYPCSPSRKRWKLGVACIDPSRAEANALSFPPGEYARKCETQRN